MNLNHFGLREIVWLAAGVMVVAIFVFAFQPQAILVDVDQVVRGPMEKIIHGEGKSRVRENYVVSAPLAGRLKRIESEPGDRVEAGKTVVAVIEPLEPAILDVRTEAQARARVSAAEAARDQAAAELVRQQAEMDFAEKELVRTRELAASGTASQRTLDQHQRDVRMYRAQVETARSNLRVAEFELESARAALIPPAERKSQETCCFEVIAPVGGWVLRLLLESEVVVAAGQPLMELGDLSDLEIVVDLLSVDAVKVSPGDRVYIDNWGGDEVLDATVRLVEPSGFTKISALGIEEQRVNVIVELGTRETRQMLGDGYRVEAYFVIDERRDTLVVPTASLFREGSQWMVYEIDGNRAVKTPVEIGLQGQTETEILSGLSQADRVVKHAPNNLEDGARIKARPGR